MHVQPTAHLKSLFQPAQFYGSMTKHQTCKEQSKMFRILTTERRQKTISRVFCLSLKPSFILAGFIEQPSPHRDVKEHFLQSSSRAAPRKGSAAEWNRKQVPRSASTVSFNSEEQPKAGRYAIWEEPEALLSFRFTQQTQLLKLHIYTRCASGLRTPNCLPNAAPITPETPPSLLTNHGGSEKHKLPSASLGHSQGRHWF